MHITSSNAYSLLSTADVHLQFSKRPPNALRRVLFLEKFPCSNFLSFKPFLLNKADAYALFWCFQVPPSSAILLYLPHNFYNSKSVDSDIVWVRPPSPAPKNTVHFCERYFFMFIRGRTKPDDGVNKTIL